MTIVNTAAELAAAMNALKAATGGVIELAPGYSQPFTRVSGFAPTGEVVIKSNDPLNRGKFTGQVTLDNPANLTFRAVDFSRTGMVNDYDPVVRVNGAKALKFEDCDISGTENGQRFGIGITTPTVVIGLTIRRCRFHTLKSGITPGHSQDVLIEDNLFVGLGSDGIQTTDTKRVKVRWNLFRDWLRNGTVHPDAMQIMAQNQPGSEDVEFSDNFVTTPWDQPAQGFFVKCETLTSKHLRISALRNILAGQHYSQVAMTQTLDALIEGNETLYIGGTPNTVTKSFIKLGTSADPGGATGIVRNNRAMEFQLENPNMDGGGNVVIAAVTQGAVDAALTDWQARKQAALYGVEVVPAPEPAPEPAPVPPPPPPPPAAWVPPGQAKKAK